MNEHIKIYDELTALVDTNDAFFRIDQERDGVQYQIFSYRLASYTDFLLPSALECRGIMFRMVGDTNIPDALVSRPMHKFFNFGENPSTMDLNLYNVVDVDYKADGSLISTYLHDGDVYVKSKGSLWSDQAVAANAYIRSHSKLHKELKLLTTLGTTVNMEWVSPDNRIVLGYEEDDLIILNIRYNNTGIYMPCKALETLMLVEILDRWCKKPTWREKHLDIHDFYAAIDDEVDIEGYVFKFEDIDGNPIWAKKKTKWYLARHHCIDSIKSPRRLYECVLREATDDMRTLFERDPVAIQKIEDMEKFVSETYNHMVAIVEGFYTANKDLERKEYAIKGQKELDRKYFGLAMNLYIGKPNDYKEYMSKSFKKFGIKEDYDETTE